MWSCHETDGTGILKIKSTMFLQFGNPCVASMLTFTTTSWCTLVIVATPLGVQVPVHVVSP